MLVTLQEFPAASAADRPQVQQQQQQGRRLTAKAIFQQMQSGSGDPLLGGHVSEDCMKKIAQEIWQQDHSR